MPTIVFTVRRSRGFETFQDPVVEKAQCSAVANIGDKKSHAMQLAPGASLR